MCPKVVDHLLRRGIDHVGERNLVPLTGGKDAVISHLHRYDLAGALDRALPSLGIGRSVARIGGETTFPEDLNATLPRLDPEADPALSELAAADLLIRPGRELHHLGTMPCHLLEDGLQKLVGHFDSGAEVDVAVRLRKNHEPVSQPEL